MTSPQRVVPCVKSPLVTLVAFERPDAQHKALAVLEETILCIEAASGVLLPTKSFPLATGLLHGTDYSHGLVDPARLHPEVLSFLFPGGINSSDVYSTLFEVDDLAFEASDMLVESQLPFMPSDDVLKLFVGDPALALIREVFGDFTQTRTLAPEKLGPGVAEFLSS